MANLSVVGKSVPRVDALTKATGAANFPSDFRVPRMLHGKIVRSPYAHARIVSIDTLAAERLPGVEVITTALNTPPIPLAIGFCDKHIFPPDLIVRYVGDAVAALAAETEDIAEEAASLIKIEYEEFPAVFDVNQAFEKNPPAIIHPHLAEYHLRSEQVGNKMMRDLERPNVSRHFKIRKGDVDKGFAEADLIVEDRYYTPKLQHCQIEPSASVAWFEPDGTLKIKASAQSPHLAKLVICHAFNLSPAKVIIDSPYIGGSFGGKGRPTTDPYAVLLSMKAHGKPVRVGLTREEHFHCANSRIATTTYIKDGVKKDGTIVSRQLRILVDTGGYGDGAMILVRNCAFGAVGLYNIANFKFDSYGVYTNTAPTTAFRGYGSPEITWAIENQMDVIAEKLGMDPLELRRRNLLRDGDRDVCGQRVVSMGAEKCLDKIRHWIEWDKKPHQEEGPWRRGKGIALGTKFTTAGYQSSAVVKVQPDGSIEVRHSSNEIGEGINTVAAQIAAESFGVSIDRIRVLGGDTSICPYGHVSASSRETFHIGNAILIACSEAKKDLFEMAAPKLGVLAQSLDIKDRKVFVKGQPEKSIEVTKLFSPSGLGYAPGKCEIIGKCTFEIPAIPEDPGTGQSERIAVYYMYGAEAVEVAVDTETGEVRILKNAGCFDGGTPINPKMCEGQIEGGMTMAFGAALYEQQLYGQKGELLNASFHDYKIPTIEDVPDNASMVALLEPVPQPDGPFGAKGIGEVCSIPAPPAISNAIYNAVGVRIKELPITGEKIVKALNKKGNNSKA